MNKTPEPTRPPIRLELRLPPKLHQDLTACSTNHRRSLNSEILIAIERHLYAKPEQEKT